MHLGFVDILKLVAIGQFFFLAVVLPFLSKERMLRNLCLSLFLLSKSLFLIDTILIAFYSALPGYILHVVNIGTSFQFGIGPALFFSMVVSTQKDFVFKPRHLVHCVPLLLSLGFMTVVYLGHGLEVKKMLMENNFPYQEAWFSTLSKLMYIHFLGYSSASLVILARCRKNAPSYLSLPVNKNLAYLAFIICDFMVFWGVNIGNYLWGRPLIEPSLLNTLTVINLFVVANTIVYQGMKFPEMVLNERISRTKYEKNLLTEQEKRMSMDKLVGYMNEKKPYLNPSLSLADLAGQLGLPAHILSQVLNVALNQNFYDFVNNYRVRESKNLLMTTANNGPTIFIFNGRMLGMNKCLKRCIVVQLLILALAALAPEGLDAGTPDQPSNASSLDSLKFLGHASVKLTLADGTIIYIDPYAGTDYNDSADIVLITHEHGDHNVLSLVKQKSTCRVIRSANALVGGVYQSFSIGAVNITAVPAYNGNHPKSSCVGYVLEFNGTKIYHAGDTGEIPEMADLAPRHLTYALLPMDGIYTMTPEQATSAAATIGAEYSIPIHTMPPPDTYSDAIVSRFTAPSKLIVRHGETIALMKGTTSVRGTREVPSSLRLCQNYPNPFNPTTSIRFFTVRTDRVTLKIYDVQGREVALLVDAAIPAGMHETQWNPGTLSSGVYLYTLRAGNEVVSRRLVLLK